MRKLPIWILLVAAAGCGGGGGDDTSAAADANHSVSEVTCPATPAQVFTTSGFAYSPTSATVNVGDIVEFAPMATHDVNDDSNTFQVGFGGDKCFQFDAAETYTFRCSAHGFMGTLTVQ